MPDAISGQVNRRLNVTVSETPRKHRISVHLLSEGREPSETDYFRLTEEELAPLLVAGDGLALGTKTTELVRDESGLSLVLLWAKPNFALPRHSHSGDCLYYVVSGSVIMGSRTLRAGDSFFVASNTRYQYAAGPEGAEVLEFRHGVDRIDMTCYGDPAAYRDKAAAVLEANRETWDGMTVSPTYEANARR
jgi:hypothetical protein